MKKSLLTYGAMVMIGAATIFNYGCNSAVKGCMNPKDDNYDAAATEDDGTCNESATSAKFERNNVTMNINGSSSNGTYLVSIAESGNDYTVTLTTNFGLTGGVSPVNFTCDVTQGTATFATTNIAQGTASGTITHNASTNKITITVTLAGFGQGIDGTTTDTQE